MIPQALGLSWLRESFQAKLLTALAGTVVLLLLGTLLAVLGQTSAQVGRTVDRAVSRSREAFAELEALRRTQLAVLGGDFTNSRRTLAFLEAALDSRDEEWLIQTLDYEFDLKQVDEGLAAFTDASGTPVVSFLNRQTLEGEDPLGLGPLAMTLLETGEEELLLYRSVGDVLYTLRVLPLVLVGRPIGTVTFGLPLDDAAAATLGNVVSAEACFLAGGRCLAATPGARGKLAGAMTGEGAAEPRREAEVDGERWAFLSESLPSTPDEEVRRILALPLDPVVAPFERILWGLLLAGLGALALALAVSYFLSRGLTRPVQAMVEATERVAAGDFEARVTVSTQDELGRLASSLNAMTEGLQLKERYRGVLNKIVSPDVAQELLKGDVILGGETRKVTILFADICEFTPLTEGMGPQEVIGLLNECMQRLSMVVEEMGGVVDKYVGDEIMAIFGAPLAQEDQATRAVMAGLRMLDAVEELNGERARRGEEPLSIRVGINTGEAVAGNMGSATRLNYTVIGEAVNLANRLAQAGEPDEVLITQGTRSELPDDIPLEERGSRELKGFSKAVPVFVPRPPLVGGAGSGAGRDGRSGSGTGAALGAVLLSLCAAVPGTLWAQAPEGGLPTLRGLGVSYLSESGAVQLDFTGRLDLEAYLPHEDPPYMIPTGDAFIAPRAQLFTDLFLGDHVYAFAEFQLDRGEEPGDGSIQGRMDQLFLRFRPLTEKAIALQVGKFAPPFGSWAERHNDPSEPFIRPPLAYDHRTMICPFLAPSTPGAFLTWREAPEFFRPTGAPPVWGVPYLWGGMLLGSVGPVNLQGAVVNGPVSSEPEDWTLFDNPFGGPSYVAAATVRISPELRIGGWYHWGPYLVEDIEGDFVEGRGYEDYVQELIGGEAVFQRGRGSLRGEVIWDRWEVPNVPDDPIDLSYSLEASYRLLPGFTGAIRYSGVTFNEIRGGDQVVYDDEMSGGTGFGASQPGFGGPGPSFAAPDPGPGVMAMDHHLPVRGKWDYDIHRLQLAAAYRIRVNTGLKAEMSLNRSEGPLDPRDDLFSLQWWWAF